jgi:hypothetical protein
MLEWTNQNSETISSLRLHSMTVEELIHADTKVESRFHFYKGIWWREVKPFFYQPAAFTTEVLPGSCAPKPWIALGGYYHMVPQGAFSNGRIVVNEVPDLAEYRLEKLKKQARYEIRRGLSLFRISQVKDCNELLNEGYDIYRDWEQRTRGVRVKRSHGHIFHRWIEGMFRHPHKLILGAYFQERLAAFIVAHAAMGVADLSKAFSHSAFHQYSPTSALIYAYIHICAASPNIHTACDGLRSTKDSLQRYKGKLGFVHVSHPAFICLRPALRPLVRWCLPVQYRRLMGEYDSDPRVSAIAL